MVKTRTKFYARQRVVVLSKNVPGTVLYVDGDTVRVSYTHDGFTCEQSFRAEEIEAVEGVR